MDRSELIKLEKNQHAVGALSKSLVSGGYQEIFEYKKPQINADKRRFVIRKANCETICCAISADSMGTEYHKESAD